MRMITITCDCGECLICKIIKDNNLPNKIEVPDNYFDDYLNR